MKSLLPNVLPKIPIPLPLPSHSIQPTERQYLKALAFEAFFNVVGESHLDVAERVNTDGAVGLGNVLIGFRLGFGKSREENEIFDGNGERRRQIDAGRRDRRRLW